MKYEKYKSVYDPVFRVTYRIYPGKEFFKEFEKYVKPFLSVPDAISGSEEKYAGLTVNCKNTIAIYLRDVSPKAQHIATMVHELNHAVHMALYDNCGVDYREIETPAYVLEFLTFQFLTILLVEKK